MRQPVRPDLWEARVRQPPGPTRQGPWPGRRTRARYPGVIRTARGRHDTAGHSMSEAVRQLPAPLLTSVWIRFGLSPTLEFVSKLLSGATCFMMDPGAHGSTALGDAYF